MSSDNPLQISRLLLSALGTQMYIYHQDRVPQEGGVLVVSNHRSVMDAPILMAALNRPIRFACHHYMGQVPVMREIVNQLGCFPLETPEHRQQDFFNKAIRLLQSQQVVGIFPEGAQPMVNLTQPNQMKTFHRGFAHLALRAPVQNLAILPVAIASHEETNNSAVPLRLLSLFDPSEPLFKQAGWHPMVVYRRSSILIGRPCWITSQAREQYQGKQAKTVVASLINYCQEEIAGLLRQVCY
ncbi:lysophospholipid acyltransferase family protein [Coleofasciculus sp. H7-2]|uniref:lysophospholipid acyltransferase family protein n=1 Tax=Coleofasciculus sp. H7-2 TaxID=3351545 RepID=UPI00366A857B